MKNLFIILALFFAVQSANSQGNPITKVVNGKTYIVHKVVSGETLYKIAKKYGSTVAEIQSANAAIKVLHPGDQLLIPQKKAAGTTPSPVVSKPAITPTPETCLSYKVKKGETLSKIAKDHQTTVEELKRINNLGTTGLKIGQILKIPVRTAQKEPIKPAEVKPVANDSDQQKPEPVVEVKPEPIKQPQIKVDDKTTPEMPVSPRVTISETAVEKEEITLAKVFGNKMDQTRTFVMHPYLQKGSIVVVINEASGQMAYCRVIENIGNSELNGSGLAITQAVADKIGLSSAGGTVKIKYAAP